MAPCALVAVHFSKDVVQQDIGTARCVWAGVIANDCVKTERGLDRFAFEPAIKEAARRFGEQFKHVALL